MALASNGCEEWAPRRQARVGSLHDATTQFWIKQTPAYGLLIEEMPLQTEASN